VRSVGLGSGLTYPKNRYQVVSWSRWIQSRTWLSSRTHLSSVQLIVLGASVLSCRYMASEMRRFNARMASLLVLPSASFLS
jgi:hypothetical protein